MPKSAKNEGRGRLLLCLGFTALFAMLAILPYWFRSEAGPRTSKQVSAYDDCFPRRLKGVSLPSSLRDVRVEKIKRPS